MYPLILFICGFSVMVLELAGVRIISPFLGSNHIVYTIIIGIIMASLSFGYWLGGKLSNKNISDFKLSTFIFSAGIYIFLLALFQFDFLRYIVTIEQISLTFKSIICSIIMFSIPSILLGTVSPYTIQLAINNLKNNENPGSIVGRYYAVSTIGSIFGTFLCGLYLIIKFGIGTIFFALSSILFFASVLVFINCLNVKKKSLVAFFILYLSVLIISVFMLFYFQNNPPKIKNYNISKLLFHKTTAYNTINVLERRTYDNDVLIMLDNYFSIIYKNKTPDKHCLGYIKFFYDFFTMKDNKNEILILGNATGTLLSAILYTCDKNNIQNINIDAIEIDKELTKIGEKYFKLPKNDNRINYFYEDARTFLNRKINKKYDLIYYDIYTDTNLLFPFHLITKETFDKINSILNNDGIFLINIIANPNKNTKKYAYLQQVYTQIKNSFQNTTVFKAELGVNDVNRPQNIIIIGFKNKNNSNIKKITDYLSDYKIKNIEETSEIFTDKFSPVEKFI